MTIEIEVYSKDDYLKRLNVVPKRTEPKILEERKDVGGGSFNIHNEDDRMKIPGLLQDRNIVKVREGDKVRGAFVIQKKEPTYVGSGEFSDDITTIGGNGLKDLFRDAGVQPYGGVKPTSYDNRVFNFSSERGTWYKESEWKRSKQLHQWGGQATNPWRYCPAEWPDAPKAYWIWNSYFKPSQSTTKVPIPTPAPTGFCYFRKEFKTTETGDYSLYMAADDFYEVYIDSQLVSSSNEINKSWQQTERIDIDLEPGNHVIGVKVYNLRGRGGLIGALYRNGDADKKIAAKLLTVTDSSWLICDYPKEAPGWTPGEVMIQLFNEAEIRGVRFPRFLKPSFTATHDSNGVKWSRDVDWTFRVGESYLDVISKIEELACDVWVDPDTYQVHAAITRGTDRTVQAPNQNMIILRKAQELLQASNVSEANIKNSLIVNTNGGMMTNRNVASIQKYGVIEDVLDLSADLQLAKTISDKVLEETSKISQGASYKLVAKPGKVPFVDYNVGDWVYAPGEDGYKTRRRVSSIGISESKDNVVEYSIEFDTIFQDRQASLERWMTNTLSGSMGGSVLSSGPSASGGSSPSSGPTGTANLKKPPAAPVLEEVVTEGHGYWTNAGSPRSGFTVRFAPVITYEDGTEARISVYEVWSRKTGRPANEAARIATTASTSIRMDSMEADESYTLFLRAVTDNGLSSVNSNSITVRTANPPMELQAPSAPDLSSGLSTISARWNGRTYEGTEYPPQFQRVQLLYSRNPNGPYTSVGTPYSRGGGTVIVADISVGAKYYFKFIAYDTLSNPSPESEVTSIEAKGIDRTAVDDAVAAILESPETKIPTLDGKNSVFILPETEPPEGSAAGDLWYVRGVDEDEGKITSVRVFNGSEWNPYQIVADSVLVPSSVGNILLKDGAVSAEKIGAKAVQAEHIEFGEGYGQSLFIGGRAPQGEALQRIPAEVTDITFWEKVQQGMLDDFTDTWDPAIEPTSDGLLFTGTPTLDTYLTTWNPIPASRKLYISYEAGGMDVISVNVQSYEGDISSVPVAYSGETIQLPPTAYRYAVVLRANATVRRNLLLNPSAEVSNSPWGFHEANQISVSEFSDVIPAAFGSTLMRTGFNIGGVTQRISPYPTREGLPVTNRSLYAFSFYSRPSTGSVTTRPTLAFNPGTVRSVSSPVEGTNVTNSSTSWTRQTVIGAPPIPNSYVTPLASVVLPTTPPEYYIDGAMFEELQPEDITLSSNMNPNPGAETNLTGAAGVGATLTRVSTWSSTGSYSFQLTASGSSEHTSIEFGGNYTALRLGMAPNKTYKLSGTIRISVPLSGKQHAAARSLMAYWQTSGNSYSSFVYSDPAPNSPGVYKLEMYFSVPANATGATIRAYNGHSSGTVWWDDIELQEVTSFSTKDYFDGGYTPASAITTRWEGTENESSSLAFVSAPTTPELLKSLTVFEVIGEGGDDRVEILPQSVSAYGSGGRTVLTHKGLEVYSASQQALLRLGHNIPTGLELYDPVRQAMVPLAPYAFGGQDYSRDTTINLPAPSSTAGSYGSYIGAGAVEDVISPTGKIRIDVSYKTNRTVSEPTEISWQMFIMDIPTRTSVRLYSVFDDIPFATRFLLADVTPGVSYVVRVEMRLRRKVTGTANTVTLTDFSLSTRPV